MADAATGLVWKRCVEGLSGEQCATGTAAVFTWQQALQAAADAEFAGHTDWRLPNKNELESLVERRCIEPAINAAYFPNMPVNHISERRYWSSSQANNIFPPSPYPVNVWIVDFF